MPIQESGEMYLETIYILLRRNGAVRSIDICEEMGYSKPSVSRAIGILKNGGYIQVDSKGYITLSDSGKELSERIYHRHTAITKFLIALGVDEITAAEDACKMEHIISDTTLDAMQRYSDKQ